MNDKEMQANIEPHYVKKRRKYLLTINNPVKYGFDRDTLIHLCTDLDPEYCCMSDEIGLKEGTPHTHIYLKFLHARSFKTIKETFVSAHIDVSKGDDWDNIDYVFKQGKWEEDEKADTNIKDSHWEWGLIPEPREPKVAPTKVIKELIDNDFKIADILDAHPTFAFKIRQIEDYKRIKDIKTHEGYMYNHRSDLEVYYIYGPTASGKSFYISTKYDPKEICVATDYKHPFENYDFQKVMVFEEFRSDIDCKAMLKYLDIYPCSLPHRYGNKFACYNKVYIISNIPIGRQFVDIQENEPETYAALVRRIKYFMRFEDFKKRYVYEGYENYVHGKYITLDEFERKHEGKEEDQEKHEKLKLA